MKSPLLLLVAACLCVGSVLAQPPAPAAAAVASGNVTPEVADKLLKANPKIILLDVRTAEEFARGHIAGAINISTSDAEFEKKVAALATDQPLLLHCASGGRSGRVLPQIEKRGFAALYHLNGGFNAWQQAGLPVAK